MALAGERWPDHTLRPAIEDLIGAGAIIQSLGESRTLSPEAEIAAAAFDRARSDLPGLLSEAVSGRELIERGFQRDVDIACELNVSKIAPTLVDRAYRGE